MKKVELLAPAGSVEVMKACIAAGADAIYMGLDRFSARAFAANPSVEEYVDALRYAHLRRVKIYLTLNTLLKEEELKEIPSYVGPLYEAGLDGIIMQDIGGMEIVHRLFPNLPIHVSTQATVTGPTMANLFKRFGVKRIVPARELSFRELQRLMDETGLETETFIHGALCYSYSGQCLFSSYIGARSANRGKCAQPCRLPYILMDSNQKVLSAEKEPYLLSLKDLNTLSLLPKILESGISSLKIEGRMKKAEYAAGVTSIYRKYIDLYMAHPDAFSVSREDEGHLFYLFNRQGFSAGYYENYNGRDMVAAGEKEFRKEEESYLSYVRDRFIRTEKKVELEMVYHFSMGEPYRLEMYVPSFDYHLTFTGQASPLAAANKPTVREDIEEKLRRIGDTDFILTSLEGTADSKAFLPASSLNAFRRDSLDYLKEQLLYAYTNLR